MAHHPRNARLHGNSQQRAMPQKPVMPAMPRPRPPGNSGHHGETGRPSRTPASTGEPAVIRTRRIRSSGRAASTMRGLAGAFPGIQPAIEQIGRRVGRHPCGQGIGACAHARSAMEQHGRVPGHLGNVPVANCDGGHGQASAMCSRTCSSAWHTSTRDALPAIRRAAWHGRHRCSGKAWGGPGSVGAPRRKSARRTCKLNISKLDLNELSG